MHIDVVKGLKFYEAMNYDKNKRKFNTNENFLK